MHIWDEYGATRMSGYVNPNALASHETNLSAFIALQETMIWDKIRDYSVHRDHKQILWEVEEYCGVLPTYMAYLLGHLDSVEGDLGSMPTSVSAIASVPGLPGLVAEMHAVLRSLWDTHESWTTEEVMLPLCEIELKLLKLAGLKLYSKR